MRKHIMQDLVEGDGVGLFCKGFSIWDVQNIRIDQTECVIWNTIISRSI